MTLDNRVDIEAAVLAACILERGAFPQVCDILAPHNFTKDHHRKIYSTLHSFYPTTPIDLVTITRALPEYHSYILSIVAQVASSSNVRYYAAVILENSIRDSFIRELEKCNDPDIVRLAVNQILNKAKDIDQDIIQILNASVTYLEAIGPSNSLRIATEFKTNFHTRVKRIRKAAAVDSVLNNLIHLTENPQKRKQLTELSNNARNILAP